MKQSFHLSSDFTHPKISLEMIDQRLNQFVRSAVSHIQDIGDARDVQGDVASPGYVSAVIL
jgi:hypothetical protein